MTHHFCSSMSQTHGFNLTLIDFMGTCEDAASHVVCDMVQPTDTLGMQCFVKGIGTQIGTQACPAALLLEQHVWVLDKQSDELHHSATHHSHCCKWALARFVNMVLWLGCLQTSGCFKFTWDDFDVTLPTNNKELDPLVSIGTVMLLQPTTKTSHMDTVDVVVTFHSALGFTLGC